MVAHRVGRGDALALDDHLDAAAYGELRGRDARLVGVRARVRVKVSGRDACLVGVRVRVRVHP